MLSSAIFIKSNLKCRFLHFTITYRRSNHPLYSQSFSSKQKPSTSVPKSPLLFNSPSPATAQKPLPSIRHICGLGASVGCERVERTFNTPRLKAQICLIEGNGFVCSLLNELNSKNPLHLEIFFSIIDIWDFGCKDFIFFTFLILIMFNV